METLALSRALAPFLSAQNVGCNSASTRSLSHSLLHPSRILRTSCWGKLALHLPSRLPTGGDLNQRSGSGWASRRRRRRRGELGCRASREGADPFHLDSDGYTAEDKASSGTVSENHVLGAARAFGEVLSTNFLIVVLCSSVLLGLAWPAPGQGAQRMGLTKWCTASIFVLSGLNIRSGEVDRAAAAWPAGLFGLVSILLITPLAAIPILFLQSSPRELVAGLAIFACVPTTLSSAVALTQITGANTTLALGITVVSNLISIVTMPVTLTTVVGAGIGVSIPPGPLLRSLIQTLLLPLLLGKLLREVFSDVAKFVDGNRRLVGVLTNCIQGLVPWMQISCSKAMLLQIEPFSLLMITAAGLALHIVYLTTNLVLMSIYPSPCIHDDYNSRAVLLVSSQKSFVVAIAVIDRLGGAFGNAGLLVLPCIAAQLSQIMTDSILVNKWLKSDAKENVRPSIA